MLLQDFTPFTVRSAPDMTIHATRAGSGPPLLLLHGFPETHHMWHAVAPALTSSYTVVAMDLRGYGASSKPGATADHKPYAKSEMAKDCVAVMKDVLGQGKGFYVCAHDRGARVAHVLCTRFPDLVKKVILLDICPTRAMYAATNKMFATAYWHWFFLIQPAPFPENMIRANPKAFMDFKTVDRGGFFDSEVLREYERAQSQEGTVTGWCEDYRAAASVDLEEAEEDEKAGRLIRAPLRVLWGTKGIIEAMFDAVGEWTKVHATGDVSGEAVEAGHFIPEERPEVVIQHIREFLKE